MQKFIIKLNFWITGFKGDQQLVKIFLVESGGNGRFRHETPKVILRILMRLKYTALPRWILMYFSYPRKKIDENISLYAVFRFIFQHWKHQFFLLGTQIEMLGQMLFYPFIVRVRLFMLFTKLVSKARVLLIVNGVWLIMGKELLSILVLEYIKLL